MRDSSQQTYYLAAEKPFGHAKQAEVEVKVERRTDFFLSLDLSLNLPDRLADFFSILLVGETIWGQPACTTVTRF